MKLFCLFKDKNGKEQWTHGTGWLIRSDLIATAGHNAFDWAHKLGPVIQVKAYIGYNGKASVSNPDVQFSHVSKVATTSEWLSTKGNKSRDVSFMLLDRPFTGVKPFKFADTPAAGSLSPRGLLDILQI